MLNLNKLRKMALLTLSNALRLHYDSVSLYKTGRISSAYQLSILAQEELGKMYMINDFVWSSRDSGPFDVKLAEQWVKKLYDHPHKQYMFHRNSPIIEEFSKDRNLINNIGNGLFDAKKQKATYVSLKRNKGKIDLKGRIEHPFQIKRDDAKNQITKVNDHLLVTGIGIRFEQYELDNEDINRTLKNKRFLKDNFENWKYMKKEATTRINSIQSFFNEEIIKV